VPLEIKRTNSEEKLDIPRLRRVQYAKDAEK